MPSPYEYNNTESDYVVRNRLYDQIYPMDNELPIFPSDEDQSINQSEEDLPTYSYYKDYRDAISELDSAYCDELDNLSIYSADNDQNISPTDNYKDDISSEDDYSFSYRGNVPIFPNISTAFASSKTRSLSMGRFTRTPQHEDPTETGWYSSLLKPFKKFRKLFTSAKKKDEDDEEFDDITSDFYGSVSSLKFSKALDYFDMLY